MLKRLMAFGLALLFPLCGALAQEGKPSVAITEIVTEMGANAVAYPQLEGMAEEVIQKKINDDIVLSADVTGHLITLATLSADSSWGLRVTHESYLGEGVFSTVISAKGKLPGGRPGHAYTALTYDLATGERLTLDSLFSDVDGAVARMETLAENSLSAELSGYLEYAEITPLPRDSFTVDEHGVTFWYPAKQLSLLSGYSGACQFYYSEVREFLRTDEDGLPARLGALEAPLTDAEAAGRIAADAAAGVLPHVPLTLGEPMPDVVERYRLARTPDEFPGGRYFVLEAPAFRSVLVISDAIQSGYDGSVAEGVQLKRGTLYGLTVGETSRERWLAMLGEPRENLTLTPGMAYDYNLPAGQCDIYRFGDNELRLYADEGGLLSAIQLSKTMKD